jgi:hypothetical protein
MEFTSVFLILYTQWLTWRCNIFVLSIQFSAFIPTDAMEDQIFKCKWSQLCIFKLVKFQFWIILTIWSPLFVCTSVGYLRIWILREYLDMDVGIFTPILVDNWQVWELCQSGAFNHICTKGQNTFDTTFM